MLKGEDIIVLLKLVDADASWTLRTLADETGIATTSVHRAIKRLAKSGLYDEARRQVNRAQAEEFLIHGARYVFPGVLAGESRGVPAAWAAAPLNDLVTSSDNRFVPVWPDPHGWQRGLALRPLHAACPALLERNPELAGRIALVDCMRVGDTRVRGVAAGLLHDWLAA